MEFIIPSLRIVAFTNIDDFGVEVDHMSQLLDLEEDRFITGFQQQVHKARDKAWHDRHIKHKVFQVGDLVLLYDRKFLKHLGKFQAH